MPFGLFPWPSDRINAGPAGFCLVVFALCVGISSAENVTLQQKSTCFLGLHGHNAKLYVQKLLGDMHIVASNETILLVMKFRIGRSLRFLSHAETLSLFQRACVRAGIDLCYSQGFNPRPKLSLPLPRPVGVESDDELLAVRVLKSTPAQRQEGTGNTGDLCSFVEA